MAFINCEARGRCENAFEREKATAGEMAQSLDGRLYLSCSSSNGYYGYLPVSRPDDCAMDTEEPERHAVQATGPARRRKASAVSDNHVVAKRPRLEASLSISICRRERPLCRRKGEVDSLESLLKGIHGCEMYHYLNQNDV